MAMSLVDSQSELAKAKIIATCLIYTQLTTELFYLKSDAGNFQRISIRLQFQDFEIAHIGKCYMHIIFFWEFSTSRPDIVDNACCVSRQCRIAHRQRRQRVDFDATRDAWLFVFYRLRRDERHVQCIALKLSQK